MSALRRLTLFVAFAAVLAVTVLRAEAQQASGAVTVQDVGAIPVAYAVAFSVRDQRNARLTRTEILLSDVAVDAERFQDVLDPHMEAINVDVLRDRNYILLWVNGDGSLTMNATFSKTMTQFLNDSRALTVAWSVRTPARLEARVFSAAPIKTMDGTSYTVDLTFAVDVPAPPQGTSLPDGGGAPGAALTALLAAAQKKDWFAIRAGSGPSALAMFDRSYNTPQENAEEAAELLTAWIPVRAMHITGGQQRGDLAVLDVEGEIYEGQRGLSLVQMIRIAGVWQFDRAARAGMIR
jgi:hypothetical protein